MLFRGSHNGAGLIRGVTAGHFDHVALIIRTEAEGKNDFIILEATGTYGVSSAKWSDIRSEIGVGKFYEKVTFRKLKCRRSEEFINKFDEVLAEVWDLKYGIGLSKIAKKVTNGNSVALK